jgi:hypothetical protein
MVLGYPLSIGETDIQASKEMANWTITIGGQAIFSVAKAWVEENLNAVGTWEVDIDGADGTIRGQVVDNAAITIYRDSELLVSGVVYHATYFQGGGISVTGFNKELIFTETKCPVTSGTHAKTYTSTNANTIFSDLVGGVSGWSANVTGSTATAITSFKTSDSMSAWNGIIQLCKLTGKDVYFDRGTLTAYLSDKKGTASVFHFHEGRDISDISYDRSRAKASKVIVYGKGDGENQIIGTAGSGTPVIEVTDKNIIDTTAANLRATKELALIQQSIKQYSFSVSDVTNPLIVGDQGKITASSLGLSAEDVDVTRTVRAITQTGIESLAIEVTNTEFRITSSSRQEVILAASKNALLSDTSMQGSGNAFTWTNAINANSTYGNVVEFYISDTFFKDDAGNIRINSLVADGSIAKFRQGVGTASESNVAPGLTGGNTASHKHDAYDSGHDHTLPSMTSGSLQIIDLVGSGSVASTTVSGWSNDIISVSLDGSYDFLYMRVIMQADSWSGTTPVGFRIHKGTGGGADYQLTKYFIGNTAFNTYFIKEIDPYPLFASSTATMYLDIYSETSHDYNIWFYVYGGVQTHSHSVTGYSAQSGLAAVADAPKTPSLTGNSDSHNHSVTVGSGIGEAVGVNAAGGYLSLDYWNGATWTSKNSVHFEGAGIRVEDVSMTSAGTYPDVTGWWRVVLYTDNATPDYTELTVRIKHNLEN